jgi:hypothetical protein
MLNAVPNQFNSSSVVTQSHEIKMWWKNKLKYDKVYFIKITCAQYEPAIIF